MKVFKFGGASVKDADGVKNVVSVIQKHMTDNLLVVVSAMGKTTNALEKVTDAYFYGSANGIDLLNDVRAYHIEIMTNLFPKNHSIYDEVTNLFVEIEWAVEDPPTGTYDFEYDQIVSIGELVSSKIIAAYLKLSGISVTWFDARDVVKTDNTYREGKIDWVTSQTMYNDHLGRKINSKISLTQGFIGCTSENFTTTLGREGSDFSAAIFAYLSDAESVTIWKDVPGVLNADPKWFAETVLLNHISYSEAIELAYYGATVIHPKTIQPLQNKLIPLYVKSFLNPDLEGTQIDANSKSDALIPSYIFKVNQTLLSILPRDYSFVVENNLSTIFGLFSKYRVKINLMENSAISFSVCVDTDTKKLTPLISALEVDYKVLYNAALELVTVRHYNQAVISKVTTDKTILLEQKSRNTIRMVMRNTI